LVRSPHAVARFKALYRHAALQHCASQISAKNVWERQLRWNETGTDINIDRVHIHRAYLDQTLCSFGFGIFQIPVLNDFRTSRLLDVCRFHLSSSPKMHGQSTSHIPLWQRPRASLNTQNSGFPPLAGSALSPEPLTWNYENFCCKNPPL